MLSHFFNLVCGFIVRFVLIYHVLMTGYTVISPYNGGQMLLLFNTRARTTVNMMFVVSAETALATRTLLLKVVQGE